MSENEIPILRERLDSALRAGADTSTIRRRLDSAERRQAEQQAAEERAEQDRIAGAQRRADEAIDAAVADRVAVLTHVAGTAIEPSYELRSAVATLAAAQRQAENVGAVVADRHAEMVELGERVASLELRKTEIAQRRAMGDCRAGDAGEVELLVMDLAELNALYTSALGRAGAAETQADAARQAVQQAGQRVQVAERAIVIQAMMTKQRQALDAIARLDAMLGEQIAAADAATAAQFMPALIETARALDAQLLATVQRIEDGQRRTGRIGMPVWGPSQPLLLKLRNLAVMRNEM